MAEIKGQAPVAPEDLADFEQNQGTYAVDYNGMEEKQEPTEKASEVQRYEDAVN